MANTLTKRVRLPDGRTVVVTGLHRIATSHGDTLIKYNTNHDDHGRFASVPGSSGGHSHEAPAFTHHTEAETWLSERHPHIQFDLEGIHPDHLQRVAQQFHSLAQEYPHVADRLRYVGTYGARAGQYRGEFSRPSTYAHSSDDGEVIGLNHAQWSKSELAESVQHNKESGWHVRDDAGVEGVLTHEFGHQVQNWLEAQNNVGLHPVAEDARDTIGGATRKWTSLKQSLDARLSDYALRPHTSWDGTKSYREAFAEGFRALHHQNPQQWAPYTKRLGSFLGKVSDPAQWHTTTSLADISDPAERATHQAALIQQRKELRIA